MSERKPTIARSLKRIRGARENVSATIRGLRQGSHFAAGMANEGYAGGYYQALIDVEAILCGYPVSEKDSRWWIGEHHPRETQPQETT